MGRMVHSPRLADRPLAYLILVQGKPLGYLNSTEPTRPPLGLRTLAGKVPWSLLSSPQIWLPPKKKLYLALLLHLKRKMSRRIVECRRSAKDSMHRYALKQHMRHGATEGNLMRQRHANAAGVCQQSRVETAHCGCAKCHRFVSCERT